MPLYLVRWPALEASIVRAHDEAHLRDILDEVASPGQASWREYDGPLWVDVNLGLSVHREEGGEWIVDGAEQAAEVPWVGATVEAGESVTADEMLGAVLSAAFPHVTKAIQDSGDAPPDANAVQAAALLDLDAHVPSGGADDDRDDEEDPDIADPDEED